MKNRLTTTGLAVLFSLLLIGSAPAATPVQFSTFDFNLPRDSLVIGVRVPVIYGKRGGDVTGFDVQLLAYSDMNSLKGFSIPPFFLLGANRIRNDMTGVSIGLLNWHQGYDTGINLGVTNITRDVRGLNLGLVNYSASSTLFDVGLINVAQKANLQLSLVNVSDRVKGLQFSAVNVTNELKGLQFGLFNCAKNALIRCFMVFNVGWRSLPAEE